MKKIFKLLYLVPLFTVSCNKNIDLFPQSNITTANYYNTIGDFQIALTGCYNGLKAPLLEEWKLTELRSDNTDLGNPSSKSVPNRDLSDLDMFIPNVSHQGIYNYWIASYFNIRNVNVLLDSLNINYDQASGVINTGALSLSISDADKKTVASEACFIRAYHYFNLVRLFGGVFLVHEPLSPFAATAVNRTTVNEIYKLIIADLQYAVNNGSNTKYSDIPATSLGRVNAWTAKALLAKVYLTLDRKSDAIPLLTDVIANSGYGLLPNYSDVFSYTNEVNKEIMFVIRYKAGGLGLGSPWPNNFAPLLSGSAVVIGDGNGYNTPTAEINSLYTPTDLRKATNIGVYATTKLYPKKFISPLSIVNDGETDWIVIRYSDVLLMLAEAQGNTPSSLALINQTRVRAGLLPLLATDVATTANFEKELVKERRLEFAFENVRWFDMLRFNKTMTTQGAVALIQAHYATIYSVQYIQYPTPRATLAQLQAYVNENKLLLPIPQREIDNNTTLVIPQNPGY